MPTCEIAPTGADSWGYPRVRSRLATEEAGAAHVVDSSPSGEAQAASCPTTHSSPNVADPRPGGLSARHQRRGPAFGVGLQVWGDRIGQGVSRLVAGTDDWPRVRPHN